MSEDGKRVAIVGAGIVGVSAAVWLQRDGFDVTLIDRLGPGEGASSGNGGILASSSCIPVTTPGLLRKAAGMLLDPSSPLFLRWRYLPRMLPFLVSYLRHAKLTEVERIAAALAGIVSDSLSDHLALAAGTEAERYVHRCDFTHLYRNRAAFEDEAALWEIRKQNGFAWEEIDGDAWRRLEPAFSPDAGFAVRMSGHGRISDPQAYVAALARSAERKGARLARGEAAGFVRQGNRVVGVRVGGETIAADAVLIAAGAWSARLARQLGLALPMESERGYHLEFWEPSVQPKTPVMVTSGKFVMTPMDGRLRVAGLVEFGGLDAPPSRAPWRLLERAARRIIPGLGASRVTRWMGHRPAIADSIPAIGGIPGAPGAFLGCGHHHIGLTGGPRTGALLAQLIAGRSLNLDLSVYCPARFAAGRGGFASKG